MTERKLEFGLQPPEGTTLAWGARAIYQSNGSGGLMVDIVWNRQSTIGATANDNTLHSDGQWLMDAVNKWALPVLRHKAAKRELAEPDERIAFEHDEGLWHLRANPNASHGYLYIVVYWSGQEDPLPPKPFKAPKPEPRRRTLTLPRNRF